MGFGATLAGASLTGTIGADGDGLSFLTSVSAPKSIVVSPLARFFEGGAAVGEIESELVCTIPKEDLSANEVKKSEPSNR